MTTVLKKVFGTSVSPPVEPSVKIPAPVFAARLLPAIVQCHNPGSERGRAHELQTQRWLQAVEQIRTVTSQHRVDHEAIFVEEVQSLQRRRKLGAADQEAPWVGSL